MTLACARCSSPALRCYISSSTRFAANHAARRDGSSASLIFDRQYHVFACHPAVVSHTQLGRLIEDHMPDLSAYFAQLGVVTHMYASQWFLTLFVAKVGRCQIILLIGFHALHTSSTSVAMSFPNS